MGKQEHVETKQHATKYLCINEEIKEEIRKYLKTNENKTQLSNMYGTQQKQF